MDIKVIATTKVGEIVSKKDFDKLEKTLKSTFKNIP